MGNPPFRKKAVKRDSSWPCWEMTGWWCNTHSADIVLATRKSKPEWVWTQSAMKSRSVGATRPTRVVAFAKERTGDLWLEITDVSRTACEKEGGWSSPIEQLASRPHLCDGPTTGQIHNETLVVVHWCPLLIREEIKHPVW